MERERRIVEAREAEERAAADKQQAAAEKELAAAERERARGRRASREGALARRQDRDTAGGEGHRHEHVLQRREAGKQVELLEDEPEHVGPHAIPLGLLEPDDVATGDRHLRALRC